MNSLPRTVTRQRRGCDLNPGPSAPESSTLTTRLPSQSSNCLVGFVAAAIRPAAAVTLATRRCPGLSGAQLRQ